MRVDGMQKSVRTEIEMFFYVKLVTESKFLFQVNYLIIAQDKPNKHARHSQVSYNLTNTQVRAPITVFR